MPHEEQHPNWRDWRLVFLLGLPLGLLELGLFAVAAAKPIALPLWNAASFDWLLYFLIAGVIEYQFYWRRRREGWDTSGTGFIVALVGCACFMLCAAVLLIDALIIPHPTDPQTRITPPAFDRSIALIALLLLAFLNVVALAFSAGGARLGRALAIRRAKRLQLEEQQL
ncbi:MAG TPA: hypothetical protein VFX24_10150 [Ktedonobacterales bacterium]|nr:hypothetical protein [Ktedonobacterales bacterium]